mgnify:CR=1 FL=1|jgi:hypothetical protein
MKNKTNIFAVLVLFILTLGALQIAPAHAEDVKPDPKAEELLNKFMTALLVEDEAASAKAVMSLVHKSLLSNDKSDLSPDLRRFSFKKAHGGAGHYTSPVKITRVRKTGITAIGFKETAEAGAVYDYFISKKEGVTGMPAPVKVFFPKDGGELKISYMGSL